MIKLFEQFNSEQEIHDICKKYGIKNYTINPDGSIDVNGDVSFYRMSLGSKLYMSKIPLKFNRVEGFFNCEGLGLTTLEGCPNYVGISFFCQ